MADNDVNIVIKATDNASATLEKVNKSMGGPSGMAGLVTAASTAWMAFAPYVKKAVDEVTKMVTETVAYNKTVREMTQVTGLGSEEISRIIQVGDDWGVSIDAIRTSLSFMNKQGITPSIDNLAKMADEYVNSADKSAWAEKATKTLGRGYQTLIPLFALGGKGLREATAGIADNMIATEKSMKASREFEVALDDLTDAFQGMKYEVGNEVIPVLSEFMNVINKTISTQNSASDAIAQYNQLVDLGVISEEKLYLQTMTYRMEVKTADEAIAKINLTLDEHRGILDYSTQAIARETASRKDALGITKELTQEQINENKVLYSYEDALITARIYQTDVTKGLYEMSAATEASRLATELATTSTDLITTAIKGFSDSLSESIIIQASYDLAMGKITQTEYEQQIANAGLIGNLEEMLKLVQDGKLDWSYLFQAMSDGKITQQELTDALMATGMSAKDAAAYVASLKSNIDALYSKEITITTRLSTIYDEHPREDYATGGDFIVPPGYPNDTYPINVSSGERVTVIPANETNRTMNVYPTFINSNGQGVVNDLQFYAKQYGMA